MASSGDCRVEKVKRIFEQFDQNRDGGLNTAEMASLVVSVNPRVQFSDEQITAILDEVFKTYSEFIDPLKGLSFEGLLRTYDDGAGDVDRDFQALNLGLVSDSAMSLSRVQASSSSSTADDRSDRVTELHKKHNWALPANQGVVYESSSKLVEDLEVLIKRLKGKQVKEGRLKVRKDDFESYSEHGWSSEFRPPAVFSEKGVVWDESGHDYSAFVKQLGVLRSRADEGEKSYEEMFDGHMAIGRVLYESHLFKEALVSFKRSCELQGGNFRPHFRAGNCLYILGKYGEAKDEFLLALEATKNNGENHSHLSHLLPQIHVNLGISLEAEGMVLSACEHYREATVICPTHFRAMKLLGSALFGVGEYKAAEKALEEAIYLKPDYADAQCDLGSTLHAMGESDRAIQELQKAIDLKPGHVDAMYNLGGLYMDMGRYQRASEMYTRILAVCPSHWRAQLNKAVALLGANEVSEARKALKQAFKMTNRVELHDAITHMKRIQKKPAKGNESGEVKDFIVVETSRFKTVNDETPRREELAYALGIRSFQRLTRLGYCNVDLLQKEISENTITEPYSASKSTLEIILRRLLHFLKPETFQGAVKTINTRILCEVDYWDLTMVDLGMFFAVLAPICSGSSDKRKRVVFDALLWRQIDEENSAVIQKVDAVRYIKLLRAVYLPIQGMSAGTPEAPGEDDLSAVSFPEFLKMFDDPDYGFGIMDTLVNLENRDRIRHCRFSCSVCRYPVTGSCFKETRSHFNLCSQCYSEGKVPSSFKQDEYNFKEYESEAEVIKDKCAFLSLHSKSFRNAP